MKKLILCLVLVLVLCPLFAASENLSELHRKNILPVAGNLGQLTDDFDIPALALLKKALETPYDLNWIETYFDDAVKGPLSLVFTPLFSELLPCFKNLYLTPVYNGSFCSIRVLVKDVVLDFIVDTSDLKIISVVRPVLQ